MFARRVAAFLIDLALVLAVSIGPTIAAAVYLPHLMDAPAGEPPTPLMGGLLLWMMVALACYWPVFESGPLQATPGKLLLGLKVVRADGRAMTLGQAFMRLVFGPICVWFLPLQRRQFSGGAETVRRS